VNISWSAKFWMLRPGSVNYSPASPGYIPGEQLSDIAQSKSMNSMALFTETVNREAYNLHRMTIRG